MKKYLSFFKIRFINSLQYRAAAFGGIFTQFAWGFMEILLYSAFYNADPAAFPMEFSQLASYVWLKEAFLAMFATYYFDNEIFDAIMSGNIAYELARPVNLYDLWFVKNLALRYSRAVLRCIPILFVAVLLPYSGTNFSTISADTKAADKHIIRCANPLLFHFNSICCDSVL